jgi:hypothetical protein
MERIRKRERYLWEERNRQRKGSCGCDIYLLLGVWSYFGVIYGYVVSVRVYRSVCVSI